MSGTLESLRRKIDSAGDLQGVVRSMKALAASSIGQYEKAVQSLDDYYRTVELALVACLHQAGAVSLTEGKIPLHGRPHEGKIGAVVFGSDQGLVGRFNEVIVEFSVHELKTFLGKITKIWAVGDRAYALLADTGVAPVRLLSVPTSVDAITSLVGQVLIEIEAALDHGDVTEVYVFHNHPKFGAVYEAVGERLVPLDHAWQHKLQQWHGRQRICRRSSKEPNRRFRLSSEDTSLFCFFRPAPNPLPAKTPAVWRPCNARKRTSKTFWKI